MTVAVLYAITVALPLWAAGLVTAGCLRLHGRQERGVWIVVLSGMLVLPAVLLATSRRAVEDGAEATVPVIALPALETLPAVLQTAPTPSLDTPLIVLWIAVSFGLAMRWAVSAARLTRLARVWSTTVLDGVEVLVSRDAGPGTLGVVHPRIVVPSRVVAMDPAMRSLVVLHEREHRAAGDHIASMFARVTRILTPWNPFVWLATSRLRNSLETDCDRRVIRRHQDVTGYAETLLAVSAVGPNRFVMATHFAGSRGHLHRRILAMTTPTRAMTPRSLAITFVLCGALAMGAARIPVPQTVPPPDQATLPPLRVITDRRIDVLILPEGGGGRLQLIPATTSELRPGSALSGLVVAGGMDGRVRVVRDRGYISPQGMQLPGPTDGPADSAAITELPRILNPEEVSQAIQRAYPVTLRERRLGGTVGVLMLVGTDGEVESVRLGQGAAYVALNEAAKEVMRVYRFSPARVGADAVAVWVQHAIDFRVN
jgi:TonB family protein